MKKQNATGFASAKLKNGELQMNEFDWNLRDKITNLFNCFNYNQKESKQ